MVRFEGPGVVDMLWLMDAVCTSLEYVFSRVSGTTSPKEPFGPDTSQLISKWSRQSMDPDAQVIQQRDGPYETLPGCYTDIQ
jgi:hypothetical protein